MKQEDVMTYKCMNCGATSEDAHRLCNPGTEELEGKLCATSTDQVCGEHLPNMSYTCATCGGLAPDAGHLCDPQPIGK